MSKEHYPGTQAVYRAVALLKTFSDARPELTLSELTRAVGLNKTTTHRLLAALEREGLVAHDTRNGAYRLGPEAIALGARALRATPLRDAAQPELEWLARGTGENADLEILDGGEVFVVEEIPGRFVIGTTLAVGTRWPAHATSTGKAILAFLPEDEREAALPRRLSRPTGKAIGDRETLRAELARVRERGYATGIEELEEDFVAVGAAVFDHEGRVVGAISIGGPSHRLPAKRIQEVAPLVKQAAERISHKLGFKPQ
ncbi:MAG: IclR family transcriptional regulator [Chloroflexi bacterium]|nr:IclR family transcriptional regulator [Chloroflexota bacterium]